MECCPENGYDPEVFTAITLSQSRLPGSGGQVYISMGMLNSGATVVASSNPGTNKTHGRVCRIQSEEAELLVTELWGTKTPHYRPFGKKTDAN